MVKSTITEIKKGQLGTGLLIENDGYISLDSKDNSLIKESIENSIKLGKELPNPLIVSAVFQKYDVENANGRIYPEHILKREAEKYQKLINEHRAYGECYKPTANILTANGWKQLKDIEVGENILTLNPYTKKTEEKPVLNVTKYKFNGNLVHIKGNDIDECVTPEHGFPLFIDHEGDAVFDTFVKADELLSYCGNNSFFIPNSLEEFNIQNGILLNEITISDEPYEGDVMCVEVENHIWYVMENGKAHWTKNCNHPSEPTIDLSRICMNIIELHWAGHTLVGQMQIPITEGFRKLGIVSTQADMIAQWLISGLKIGVSSRGLGTVTQQGNHVVVNDDYEIVCWDVVATPSTPNAYIESDEQKLQPYIQEHIDSKVQNTLNEDKFSKFDKWLLS